MILETHQKKAPEVLRRTAKQNGGGPKGAFGVMSVEGRKVEMRCENESVPGNMPKRAQKFFNSKGFKYKFIFILPGGEMLGDDEDDSDEAEAGVADSSQLEANEQTEARAPDGAAEPEDSEDAGGQRADASTDAARERMMGVFRSMNAPLREALAHAEPPVKQRLSKLSKAFGTEIKGEDMRRAAGVLQLLKKTLEETTGASAGPDPETEMRLAKRTADLDNVEADIDALIAQFRQEQV